MDADPSTSDGIFGDEPRRESTPVQAAPRGGRRRTPKELLVVIVLASAVLAAFADAAPTGHGTADVIWRALAGALVPIVTADARRWSWFPLAGVAAAVGRGVLGLGAGVLALALTFAAGFGTGRRRWLGAATGALAVQALLRGVTYGPLGTPTLVAFAAVVPVAASALRNASRRMRRVLAQTAAVLGVIVVVLTAFTAVSALGARDRISGAITLGEDAVSAAEDGDAVLAGSLIREAGEELDSVADDFDRPWLAPARFVPVLGQHAGALRDLSRSGSAVAARAADVLFGLDPDTLLPSSGRVDVDQVSALIGPMSALRGELGRAIVEIDDIDQTWLATPAADRVDELSDTLTERFDEVADLDDVLGVVPAMLGADEERRYLVMFMTPAESRGAGGFAANWAEIVADNGRITVTDAGRGDDLNDLIEATAVAIDPPPDGETIDPELAPPGGRAVLPDNVDLTLYDGWRLTELFQNLPAITDFPTMAGAGAAFYEQATGEPVHGVIGVDPDAMAGLVTLTGPIEVAGRTFDGGGLRDFVLTGQYVDYAGDEAGRVEALDELTFGVFEALLTGEPPSPTRLVDVFAPLVRGNRLRMVAFDESERAALASIDLDDPFPRPAGQDLLAVVTQNLGENKIDTFLRRSLRYGVTVDPATGEVVGRLEITLFNDAPATGLPGAIIGNNDLDFRPGTNRIRVQVYTPLQVTAATVGPDPVPMTVEAELGWNRYRRDLFIDAGSSVVLTLELAGLVDTSSGYVLDVEHQPLVNDDQVEIAVTSVPTWTIGSALGIAPTGTESLALESDRSIGVTFSPTVADEAPRVGD